MWKEKFSVGQWDSGVLDGRLRLEGPPNHGQRCKPEAEVIGGKLGRWRVDKTTGQSGGDGRRRERRAIVSLAGSSRDVSESCL